MPVIVDCCCEFCGDMVAEDGFATPQCIKCAEERDAEFFALRAEIECLREATRPVLPSAELRDDALTREEIAEARRLLLGRACKEPCNCLGCAAYRTAIAALDAYEAHDAMIENAVQLLAPRHCTKHTGANTPPFAQFAAVLNGRCHFCDVAELHRLREAQRPRPAGEAPQHSNSVIVWDSFLGEYFPERATYRNGEWYCEETGGEKEYRRDAPAYWSECPPPPERDDG